MKFRISNPYRFLPSLYLFHEKNRTTQTKERTRIEEIIFEIEYRLLTTTPPPHELSSRNVFWTILTNENRPTTRGEAISTSHLPKIPLIFHPPIFKTKAFHPLILEEARLEQISLSLSLSFWDYTEISRRLLARKNGSTMAPCRFTFTTFGTDISKLDDA